MFEKGDWVSFMNNRHITIAQVEYVNQSLTGKMELATTEGHVYAESVLECRRLGLSVAVSERGIDQ